MCLRLSYLELSLGAKQPELPRNVIFFIIIIFLPYVVQWSVWLIYLCSGSLIRLVNWEETGNMVSGSSREV